MKQKNIIIFHGYTSLLDDENFNCIIMEYAKYGNLRNFQIKVLKRPFLSESMLCFLFSQVLNGLIYLHRCKVAHMDIKPQNIVIDEFLNSKLIDFSISINYKDKEPDDEIKLKFKGTNFYMPIEIHNEETIKYKDLNKIDAYGLGITLYSLAYGCYPFDLTREDSKDYDSIYKKINGKLQFKNDFKLSSYFRDFISKLLEKDINKRMSIYEAARQPWIKGAEIIMKEKEKMYNISPFVVNLMTNNIKKFNDFLDM
jgi:serine/threonine-protein kinase Chk1